MTRSIVRYGFAVALTLGFVLFAAGKQNLTSGPPPEIRRHIDALLGALNSGDSGEWEKMAQEQFSPDELKRHSVAERKAAFDRLRRDFGTISLGQVEGPDEPLRLHITGSIGASGIIELSLERDAPYRIDHIGVKIGEDDGSKSPSTLDPPGVKGTMASDELNRTLDSYFSMLVSKGVFSGNVLIAKDGKGVYERSFGLANRADKLPNIATTRFNIGSINKTFTKTAIQQLIARGSLSLNDTVGKLLPDYPREITRAATLEQLLGHTAGVADFFGEEFTATAKDRFRSNADYYKFVSNLKPLFVPGARKQYCNGCYIVLGAIIERVSGKPYEQYVKDNIFTPAGMTTAGPLQSDGIIPNVAVGYTRHNGNQELQSNLLMHGASGSAAGGGYARTADLLAYANALRDGHIPDVVRTDGLGIAGGAPGINSVLEEKGQWTVIVLSNLDPPVGEEIGRLLSEALSR